MHCPPAMLLEAPNTGKAYHSDTICSGEVYSPHHVGSV